MWCGYPLVWIFVRIFQDKAGEPFSFFPICIKNYTLTETTLCFSPIYVVCFKILKSDDDVQVETCVLSKINKITFLYFSTEISNDNKRAMELELWNKWFLVIFIHVLKEIYYIFFIKLKRNRGRYIN